jgi:hypothetical protein
MALSIIEALAKLDPKNDNHWTIEGEPRLDTVKFFVGVPNLIREDLIKVATFTRADAIAGKGPTPVTAAPAAPTPATGDPAPAAATGGAKATGNPPPAPAAPVIAPPPAPEKPFNMQEAKTSLAELDKELEGVNQEIYALNKKKHELNLKADPIRDQIAKNSPPDNISNAVQGYHARQKEILAARADQLGRVKSFEKESGVKIADLIPKKSVIDQALARKTGRGTARPK